MLGRQPVLSLVQARKRLADLLAELQPVPVVQRPLADCLGAILGQELRAPENLPPAPRSTMDGYAVRARETFGASEAMPSYLEVGGSVAMGERVAHGPKPGACFSIATGGFLPPETDAVVMLEYTVRVDATMIEVVRPVGEGSNVIATGEDVAQGQLLFGPGHLIRPQDIGLLAALGFVDLAVHRRVRAGIIATGDELVPHDQPVTGGQIRDANSPHLQALVEMAGGHGTCYGITRDEPHLFHDLLTRALAENDLVLFSGSSSVGSRDMGEQVMARIGRILLHGVAVKPGKPVLMGQAGNKPIFGLPGHPVSAAVAFDLLVRPTLAHLGNRVASQRLGVRARLSRNVASAAGRRDYIRVRLQEQADGLVAEPLLGKSSALSSLAQATGFFEIPEQQQGMTAGERVLVQLYEPAAVPPEYHPVLQPTLDPSQ